jgi:hypothetical protein
MDGGPRRTDVHRTGQVAEAAFAKAVTEAGLIWHPTAAGSDFGIDGKVEVVSDEIVSGAEFNVQIKGTLNADRITDKIDLGPVKVTTMTYWMTKLRPTLLIVHDQQRDELYYGWFHDIVMPVDIFERQRTQTQRMRLRMEARRLNADAWTAICADTIAAHEALEAAFDHTPVRSYYHMVYCLAADVSDILTDVVTDLAYSSPLILALEFGDPENRESYLKRFIEEMPTAPQLSLRRDDAFLIPMVLEALDHELQGFLVGRSMFHADNPIVRSTESVQRTLRGLLSDMMHPAMDVASPEPSKGDGPRVSRMMADIVKLVYGAGLILVLLRDYQRELRPFLFPIWGKIEWPVRDGTSPPLGFSMKLIRSTADEMVTSFVSRQPAVRSDPGVSPKGDISGVESQPDSRRGRSGTFRAKSRPSYARSGEKASSLTHEVRVVTLHGWRRDGSFHHRRKGDGP